MTYNTYKTSDIRISKDRVGSYTATHLHQGILIDCDYFFNRNEARKAAVQVLKEKKEEQLEWDIH